MTVQRQVPKKRHRRLPFCLLAGLLLGVLPQTPAEARNPRAVRDTARRILKRPEFRQLRPLRRSGNSPSFRRGITGGNGSQRVPSDSEGNPVIVRDDEQRGEIQRDDDGRALLGRDEEGRKVTLRDEQGREVIVRDFQDDDVIIRDEQGRPVTMRDQNGRRIVLRDQNGRRIVHRDEQGRPIIYRDEQGRSKIERDREGRAVIGRDEQGNDVRLRDDRGRRVLAREDWEMRGNNGGRRGDNHGGQNGWDNGRNARDGEGRPFRGDGISDREGDEPRRSSNPQDTPTGNDDTSRDASLPAGGASMLGGVFTMIFQVIGWIVVAVVVVAMIFLIVQGLIGLASWWRDREQEINESSRRTAVDNPLEPESSPGELPADVYVAKAHELASTGQFREAIAHLLLGGMSHLERNSVVTFRRGLTHRDYVRAVRSHPQYYRGLRGMVRLYEPLGFGRRTPTRAHFEQSLAAYEAAFRATP